MRSVKSRLRGAFSFSNSRKRPAPSNFLEKLQASGITQTTFDIESLADDVYARHIAHRYRVHTNVAQLKRVPYPCC